MVTYLEIKWQSSHNTASLEGDSAWGGEMERESASSFEGRLIIEAAKRRVEPLSRNR